MSPHLMIFLCVLFLIIGGSATFLSRRYDTRRPNRSHRDRRKYPSKWPDKSLLTSEDDMPYPDDSQESDLKLYASRSYLCSKNELLFYYALKKAFPELTIMSKVRLADILTPDCHPRSPEFQSAFNSIRSKHVDFLVCTPNLKFLFVIELDDSSHNAADRISRDNFLNDALTKSGVSIYRFNSKRQYSSDVIRSRIPPRHIDSGKAAGTPLRTPPASR